MLTGCPARVVFETQSCENPKSRRAGAREALAAGDVLSGSEGCKVQQRARSGVGGHAQTLRVTNPGLW